MTEYTMNSDAMARLAAFRAAIDLMHVSHVDYYTEDLLIVADWIATGSADLALRINDQNARNYRTAVDGDTPDAVRYRTAKSAT